MTAATTTQTVDILVTGVGKVGKSTFIKTISQQLDTSNPVGWLMGTVPIADGLDAQFIEPPALPQFDFHWHQHVIGQADVHGVIVLCDSTRPQHFGEMIAILETVRGFYPDMPCVLAANKQDKADAWNADDIRVGLGIPDSIPVLPCVATAPAQVGEIIVCLLESIWAE